jgi:hypothetical protein
MAGEKVSRTFENPCGNFIAIELSDINFQMSGFGIEWLAYGHEGFNF